MKQIFFRVRFWLIFLLLFLGLMPSCDYSYFEMDQVPDYNYQPVYALPLVHSTLTISDMVPEDDDDLIEVGEDNLISLVYSDHLVSAEGGLLFQLPNISFPASFSADPSETKVIQTFTQTFSYDSGFEDQVDSIVFSGGILGVQISAPGLTADGYLASVTLTFPASYNEAGETFSMTLDAGSASQKSLEGYTFLYYSTGDEHNRFDVNYEVTFSGSGDPVNAPYTFQINQDFQGMKMGKIVGSFAPRTLNLGAMGVNIGIFDSDFEGELFFADPRVRLSAWNSFGLDLHAQTNELLLQSDEGEISITGYPIPWIISGPGLSQMGESVFTELILDKNNSNVNDGVDLYPHTLYSNVSVQLNPSGGKAFVLEESKLDVEVELELPLHGTATGFSLKDTLELSNNDSIKEIEWIELAVEIFNGLPVELSLQVEFADSLNQVQGVLFEGVEDFKLIGPAQVDGNGSVITPERTYTLIMLDEIQTQAFLNSKQLFLSARVSTANQGEDVVRIYDDQTLEVRIGARIKGNVNIEF